MKKNPIKKLQKLKLPLKKMTTEQKDYVAVLLEDMNSNMKSFLRSAQEMNRDIKKVANKG